MLIGSLGVWVNCISTSSWAASGAVSLFQIMGFCWWSRDNSSCYIRHYHSRLLLIYSNTCSWDFCSTTSYKLYCITELLPVLSAGAVTYSNLLLLTSWEHTVSAILFCLFTWSKNTNFDIIQCLVQLTYHLKQAPIPWGCVGHIEECQVQAAAAVGRGGEGTSNRIIRGSGLLAAQKQQPQHTCEVSHVVIESMPARAQYWNVWINVTLINSFFIIYFFKRKGAWRN